MTSSPSVDHAALASLSDIERVQVALLHDLVAIPSLSAGEADAVAFLVDWMGTAGLDAHVDAAGNAVGSAGSGDRHVVLLGHIDTVPGNIPVRIEDGVLWGRGAVDAKGPLATFAAATAAVHAAGRLNCRVTVVGAVGEESIGSPGATEVASWPTPDLCIIGEPSGWDAVCLGYRGTLSFTYELREAGRHTAGPGESVCEQAVAFWNAVCADADRRNGEAKGFNAIACSLRGMNSESDGLYDVARLNCGLRLPPGIDPDEILATVRTLAGAARIIVHGAQAGYRSDRKIALVPPFNRAIRAEGGTPGYTVKLGTSDMNVVGPVWQRPILAYGPGDASLDHTPDERIELDEYLRAVRVLTEVLAAL
jgi:[amino group carrier protein]-lysine/ornithine hydrolase